MMSSSIAIAAALALAVVVPPVLAAADVKPRTIEPRDGHKDFDWIHGRWTLWVKRLKEPLKGSTEWIELKGTSTVRPVLGGYGNVDEFEAEGPSGKISALTVRLYSPTSRQWSIYWGNVKKGTFDVPTVGEFKDGRGEFYDQEVYEGRNILVRYIWSNITPKSAHFEQAFSADGGKTWEVNWVSDITRVE